MLDRNYLYCLFFLLCVCSGSLYAETRTITLTETTSIGLPTNAEIFEDTTGALSIDEVSNGSYGFHRASKGWNPYLGFTKSAFWLRINLHNLSQEKHWYINVWGGSNRKSEAYIRTENSTDFKPIEVLKRSRGRVYTFTSETDDRHTLYIRVQDLQLPLDLAIDLKNSQVMLGQVLYYFPIYSVMMGGLFTLALYNFVYFLYVRDRGFLALSIFIMAFVMEMGGHMGVWHYFPGVREVLSSLGGFFGFLAIAGAISLICNLLELRKYLPSVNRWGRVIIWLSIGLAILSPIITYSAAAAAALAVLLLAPVPWILGRLVLSDFKFPISFILAIVIFIAGITPSLLMASGLIELNGQITDLSPLALLVSLLLVSFTQAEKVRDKSAQAERTLASNEAKDEFLTTMSHELRTPMHAVVGAGRLLKLTSLSKSQKELVSRLNSSSKHMLSLINDILDLSRAENNSVVLEERPFKLSELLQSLDKLLAESAKNRGLKLSLVNHFTSLNLQVTGDATRLRQILLNLLSNAIKFTEQGSVDLTVTPVSVGDNQVSLCFEVIDTGIGIPLEQQTHLFNPFTQAESSTTRKYGGSGLGLAISHKLVDCMGGVLQVKSVVGQGSRFFFTLDLGLKKISETNTPQQASTKDLALGNFSVLLVDDDEMNRFFGEKLLNVCGVNVAVAESGEQALELLQQQSFDLVFMDVSMPGMSGYETTSMIRKQKQFEHLIIIALTAHAIAGERERCLNVGMNDFLTKPFGLDSLKSILEKWLSGQKVANI